jgi:hypothetical protein
MKKIFFVAALLTYLDSLAQENFRPALKQGTKIKYVVYSNGQDVPLIISLDSLTPSYIKLGWDIEGYGAGAWVMGTKSIESAAMGYWANPSPGSEEKVPDDQQVLIFSKAMWNALQTNKKMEYDQQTFSIKEPTEAQRLKLAGKNVDAILVESASGIKMWILNDAAMPVLLKIEGNTKGPDLMVTEII